MCLSQSIAVLPRSIHLIIAVAQLREPVDEEVVISLVIRRLFTNLAVAFELERKYTSRLANGARLSHRENGMFDQFEIVSLLENQLKCVKIIVHERIQLLTTGFHRVVHRPDAHNDVPKRRIVLCSLCCSLVAR